QSTPPIELPSTSSVADIFQSLCDSTIVFDNMRIIPFQSPNVSDARNDTLMSFPSIIFRSDNSSSTSYFLTFHKRSIDEMELHFPLSAFISKSGNPFIEEYLLRE